MSFTRGIFWMMSALISVLPQRMPIKCMSYGLWKSLALDRFSPTLADCLTAYRRCLRLATSGPRVLFSKFAFGINVQSR